MGAPSAPRPPDPRFPANLPNRPFDIARYVPPNARTGDLLGRFTLTDRDFADLTRAMMGIASRHASGRVVSVLEGGYSLDGLASAAAAHVEALMNSQI